MTPEGGNGELESLRHQLHVVTEVSNQLATRLFAVESRLAQLEGGARATPPPLPPAVAQHLGVNTPQTPPPLPPPLPQQPPPLPPPAPVPPPPPPPPQSSGGKIETQVGLTWANRIGVVTLIIGVAFAFKYLVDNDYIGASGRVILGVIAAALALYAGDVLWHRGQRIFAQGLTGLGIAILYLSFFAAFEYYHLIPQAVALLLMVVTTTCGGALALRYNARAIAILSFFGGYATPVMLSTGSTNDIFFASYMIVLNAVGLWVARQRNWRIVEALALFATLCLEGAWIADRYTHLTRPLVIGSTLVQYALFASGPMWVVAAVAHLAASVAIGSFHWNPIALLVLAVAGLGIGYWRKWRSGPPVVFLGWWMGFAAGSSWNGYASSDPVLAVAYCTGAFLILLAYPVWLSMFRHENPDTSTLATMGINGAIYFGVAHDLLNPSYGGYMGLFAVVVAALYLAAGWLMWNAQTPAAGGDGKRDTRTPMLAAGMALAFLALAVPIQFTGYRVAIAWAIQAAALGFIASRMPSWKALIGAAAVAILALGDLPVGIDYAPAGYRPLLNPDFVTFSVVALSLWLLAYFVTKTPGVPEWAAGPPYVIGHFVFLTGLHYEIFQYLDWTKHGWNSKLLASTLLLAIYGICLLMIGIRSRTVINRVMGLVLFAVVIFKLYLSDVWMFDVIFKMVAFLALGGLLVAGSYLYSRYRSRIETLWKKDDATA